MEWRPIKVCVNRKGPVDFTDTLNKKKFYWYKIIFIVIYRSTLSLKISIFKREKDSSYIKIVFDT